MKRKRLPLSSLKKPYRLEDVQAVVESWRGVAVGEVPAEIQVIGMLTDSLDEAVKCEHYLQCEVQSLENHLERVQKAAMRWPDAVAMDRDQVCRTRMHRAALDACRERHDTAIRTDTSRILRAFVEAPEVPTVDSKQP